MLKDSQFITMTLSLCNWGRFYDSGLRGHFGHTRYTIFHNRKMHPRYREPSLYLHMHRRFSEFLMKMNYSNCGYCTASVPDTTRYYPFEPASA